MKWTGKRIILFIVVPLVVLLIIGSAIDSNEADTVSSENTKQQEHVDKVKALFSAWDGSCYSAERYIKEHMNDADSYEHVKTVYAVQKDDKILVETTYRGNNALGAKVINTSSFLIDLDGNILKVE